MGFVFFLLLGLGFLELPRGIFHTLALWDSNDGTSVARILAILSLVGASLVAMNALRGAAGIPTIKKFTLTLDRLPVEMNGTTVVQLSDVHVGPTIKRPRIEALVQEVNSLNPDLVVITGDLVDGSVADLRDSVAPLANLRSRYGTFFVTGNHEYYSGVDSWVRELESLGIRVLRNECVSIGEGEASFDLAGVDDATARFFGNGHGADYDKALENHNSSKALVFLAHQPRQVYKIENTDIDLMLTGHTHGGQIWPFGFLVRVVQPYLAGMVRHKGINLYISRGVGYWGPPMRLKAPAEISHFTLESSVPV
jgi:predicted MPP superfamily phosphohydrolase